MSALQIPLNMSTNTTTPWHYANASVVVFYNRLRLKENEFSFRAQTLPALLLTLTLTVESLRYFIFHTRQLLLSFAPQKDDKTLLYIPRHPREMYTRNTRKNNNKKKCIFPFCFSFCCFLVWKKKQQNLLNGFVWK